MAPRTVFITGASRGIGLEFVKQFLAQKNPPKHLFAACRDPSKADELQSLAQKNKGLKIVKLDVTKNDDITAAFEQTKGVLGEEGLNLLINNAGIISKADAGFLEHITREQMQSHFDTNATSPMLVTQGFLPLLKIAAEANASKPIGIDRAAVVNISSSLGSIEQSFQSNGNWMPYKSSKAALDMLTALVSIQLKDAGILVTALCPGWVKTDMGGPDAPLFVVDSVSSQMLTLSKLNEQSSGKLFSYDGTVVPW